MRLLFATKPHLPVLGGAQLTTHYLAEELGRRGHEVTVLALAQPLGSPGPKFRPSHYDLLVSDAPEQTLARRLAAAPVDAVVVGGYHARTSDWGRSMLRVAAGVPTVLYLHDSGTTHLVREVDLEIDRVAVVSRFLAEEVRAAGVHASCIEPIVDRRHYRVASSRETALFINPVVQKGVEVAFALAEARPDISFAFVRCWRLEPARLESLRARAARAGNVEIRESTTDPQQLYGDARVLLVPSVYPEAWPRVAAEAQVSGIPVIGSNVGGIREAAGGVGTFIGLDEPVDTWANALSKAWDDESYHRQVGLAHHAGLRRSFAAESVARRFEGWIRELVQARWRGSSVEVRAAHGPVDQW